MRPHADHCGASALLIVLWAVVLLSGAVLGLALYFADSQDEQTARAAAFRCGQLAESGVAVALNPLVERFDPVLNQTFESGESFETRIISEGARINLNAVVASNNIDLLLDLFAAWGLDANQSAALADAVFDYVDEDDLRRLNGGESKEYEAIGRRGLPRNKPFETPEEVGLVLGWDLLAALKPDWDRYFTIWGAGKIDVNDADTELLLIATGASEQQIGSLVSYRDGADGERGTDDDILYESIDQVRSVLAMPGNEFDLISDRLTVEEGVSRVESTGKVGRYEKTLAAIVQKGDRPAIYAWLYPPKAQPDPVDPDNPPFIP